VVWKTVRELDFGYQEQVVEIELQEQVVDANKGLVQTVLDHAQELGLVLHPAINIWELQLPPFAIPSRCLGFVGSLEKVQNFTAKIAGWALPCFGMSDQSYTVHSVVGKKGWWLVVLLTLKHDEPKSSIPWCDLHPNFSIMDFGHCCHRAALDLAREKEG
jgi:hypothetical protein